MGGIITHKLSYGMYVVTTLADGKPQGCIANCAVQITSEPQTLAVSINHNNYTNECIKKCGKFAVSILAVDSDAKIIGTFGFKSGRDIDKFAGVAYTTEDGLPVITDSCGYMVCDVIDTWETSTHTVFLGKIGKTDVFGNREQMTYDYYHKVIKGSSPKNAPTFVPPEKLAQEPPAPAAPAVKPAATASGKKKYVCSLCGYEYEGDELPEGFECPICGAGVDFFEEAK